MSRALSLLMATIITALLIGLAAPSIASRAEDRLRASVPFARAAQDDACRSLDPGLVEFVATLNDSYTPGRVMVLDDGTIAVLIVVADVDDSGAATAIDFAASLRVSAIVIRSADVSDLRAFDPAVRNGAGLRAPGGAPIEEVSFCYRVTFPAPPKAQGSEATAEPTATTEIEPVATELTLDVSTREAAVTYAAQIVATATAAADAAATEVAAARASASALAASATAAANAASATVSAQETAIAAAEASAAAAQATLAAFEATLTAPTSTPVPEPTPTPLSTFVAFQTTGDDPFAAWNQPDGWNSHDGIIATDGSAGGSWLVAPASSTLAADMAVEIEFRVTGGELCPRNFGVGVRMSESGYQAGGIEWACGPEAAVWSATGAAVRRALTGIDLEEGWHTLRVSAVGEEISVAIDGTEVIAETAPSDSSGRLIAVWSDGVGLEIRAVTVFEVAP